MGQSADSFERDGRVVTKSGNQITIKLYLKDAFATILGRFNFSDLTFLQLKCGKHYPSSISIFLEVLKYHWHDSSLTCILL